MIKIYIKQALQMIGENRLISSISMIGTAISIAMIMIVVLVIQIQLAAYYPEENRGRMMFVESGTEVTAKNDNSFNRGNMSIEAVKNCFYTLKTPEAVSAYAENYTSISPMDKRNYTTYSLKQTDAYFWKIFNFRFLSGAPFSEADVTSGIAQAVITESVARKLFGTTDVAGKEIRLDVKPYRICGVVADVSKAADAAYADVWVPYTSDESCQAAFVENMHGQFSVLILARSSDDFDAIRQELQQQTARYNTTKTNYEINFFKNPITQWDKARGSVGQIYVEWKEYWLETGGLLIFLLLVPALNLLGVTQSAVQKRQAEIGVRKAFGATGKEIIRQVLYENGVTTLIGGAFGLILSMLLLPLCKDFLLKESETLLSMDMIFQPAVFLLALFFCLVLNLLSAGLPAWLIARKPICNALKNEEETNK